jgi:NADP-dependent 3-hydroxy acid dehydrogenase YdfG
MSVLDMFRLDDRVVVVTGASSGLGVAFAQAFGEAGADVVLAARPEDKLYDTAALAREWTTRLAGGHRLRQPSAVHRAHRVGDVGVRSGRRPHQQRRCRHRGPGHP